MNGNAANLLAGKLTTEQAEAPKYSRISVEPIDPNGGPDLGFRVMARDLRDYSKYTELAR